MSKSRELTRKTIVWPFILVIFAQMMCAGLSVYTLSGIRANVMAESLWSKGQHEALYSLSLYLNSGDDQEFRRYQAAVAIPLTARRARLALQAATPDPEAARVAYLEAGNAPGDVARMIWMFVHFRSFSYFKEAIDQWTQGDDLIFQLDRLADEIRANRPWMTKDPNVSASWLQRLKALNDDIRPHAIAFSKSLADGARTIEGVLATVNVALAGVLAALTVWRVRRFLHQRQLIETALARQASQDHLTGIANRRAFENRLDEVTAATAGTYKSRVLIFLDLDQFKIINDTCGHAAGDDLLRRLCAPLQAELQQGDLLARLGGDEFSILLTDCTMSRAISVAEALRASVQNLDFVWDQRAFRVTASLGVAHTEQRFVTSEALMRSADMACFIAKDKGRNRVHMHHQDDQDILRHAGEMNWVHRIHQALKEDRFCLFAQDIAPLGSNRDTGVHLELLIRLRDETGALVPPANFLPAAERFGLMSLIDRWVVRSAFQILANRLADADAEAIACCAINLSGVTIGDKAFLSFLDEAFSTFCIPPSMICFEITETCAITNLNAAEVFVRDLRALGCRFSLDDFGSGMSSFGYLKQLPVDFIKIDGGFVKNMLNDPVDRAMVETINHIGHVMGKKIIAEFVESESLAEELGTIGIDYGQGYGIARPKPFDEAYRSAGKTTRVGSAPAKRELIAKAFSMAGSL